MENYYSNTTLVKVKFSAPSILEGTNPYSNTTLVKVKFNYSILIIFIRLNSNTTLVKVKWYRSWLVREICQIQIQHLLKLNLLLHFCYILELLFKYNTC